MSITCCDIQKLHLGTRCTYVFHLFLTINTGSFRKQNSPTCSSGRCGLCSLRSTNLIFMHIIAINFSPKRLFIVYHRRRHRHHHHHNNLDHNNSHDHDHNHSRREHTFLLNTLTVATTKVSFIQRRSKYFGVCLDEKKIPLYLIQCIDYSEHQKVVQAG